MPDGGFSQKQGESRGGWEEEEKSRGAGGPEGESSSVPPAVGHVSFSSSTACTPHLLTYNVNSLSYYSTSDSALQRKGRILEALGDFIKTADVICLQETNLAPSEKFTLTHLPGCTIAHNNYDLGKAGTLIIDTPRVTKFFTGSDVPLPLAVRGRIQLRRYTPKDPSRSPFQVFNFYLKAGPDFAANTKLLTSLLDARPSLSEGGFPTLV